MTSGYRRVGAALAACVLILSVGATVFIAVGQPEQGDSFTEFYVLGDDGSASSYPTDLVAGERGAVTVGVVNHEHEVKTYTIVVRLDGTVADQRTVTVPDDERSETEMSFTPRSAGPTRVQFLLYDEPNPSQGSKSYRTLRLWINVSEQQD
jgi:uncharacterized membrane protein